MTETGVCRGTPDPPRGTERADAARKDPREAPASPAASFRAAFHERRPRLRGAADELEPSVEGPRAIELGAASFSRGAPEVGVVARTGATTPVRVLVAEGRGVPEARIELRGGAWAGASIHLVTDAAGIQVRLAAPTDAAHRALAAAIDRARLHLRTRGIVVRAEGVVEAGMTEERGRATRDRRR